jgi:AbrB family looped-hinge helix DNA binding protein
MGSSKAMKAKVSNKGWVVIPAALRRRYGLQPGTMVEFREESEKLYILPDSLSSIEKLYGKLAGAVSLTEALLEDRRTESEREEAAFRVR